MAKKRKSAKDVMLPHSEAKVAFYRCYLEKYLSIMSVQRYNEQVQIFDVFCGMGVYANGGHGSPIQAMEAIQKVRKDHPSNIEFVLYLNDVVKKYVEGVKEYIEQHFETDALCKVRYLNVPAKSLFNTLGNHLEHQSRKCKNLLFIDPYGYKDIHRETLMRMLKNRNTEILLFLPISFMHRFSHYAFDGNANKGALPLREFISEFFPEDHIVRQDEPMDVMQYIAELTNAFSFEDEYYSTSYFIKRDTKNYFALFFITPNLLGLERAVDSMWMLDEVGGRGFRLSDSSQLCLFDDFFEQERNLELTENLRVLIIGFLSCGSRTNCELYRYVLQKGFRMVHANDVLRKLQKDNQITVYDMEKKAEARKNSFYLNYKSASDFKTPKVRFELKK